MNKLEQAARQALEALEVYEIKLNSRLCNEAITALREALDHIPDATKMVGCAYCNNPLFAGTKCNNCGRITLAEPQVDWYEEAMRIAGINAKNVGELRKLEAEQAEQEPMHWVVPDFGFLFPSEDAAQRYLINIESDAKPTPCYAAPVRTKDLTEEEIEAIVDSVGAHEVGYWQHVFARAVIAADREKNK